MTIIEAGRDSFGFLFWPVLPVAQIVNLRLFRMM
jgi:hypothetical protein